MERVEYGTDGYPYKLSMSTGIENTEQYPTVEAIPKADYENRLKADMAAMLTDIQLDIEGQKFDVHIDKDVWNDAIRVCSDLIQQRINELKGDNNEQK